MTDSKANWITGAEALVKSLEKMNVEYVFGYPGGASLPIFDALYDAKFNFVLVRHEQGATHMADGYARVTGKPAAVLVTSGPGATNTITGIYTAFMDSVPMIVMTGQVGRNVFGKDSFQEVDIYGLSMPVVKHSYVVTRTQDIPRIIQEAVVLSQSGRPGPVLIDFPKDIVSMGCEFPQQYPDPHLQIPGYKTEMAEPEFESISKIGQLLMEAQRPVIIAGQGAMISRAGEELLKLAEALQIPVMSTLLGKSVFPERHDLSLGMVGMHGTAWSNKALTRCDLVMSIGSRWDDRINGDPKNFCVQAKKIHIDIDPAEINKIITPDAYAVGDAKKVLQVLNSYLQTKSIDKSKTFSWCEELNNYKKSYPLKFVSTGGLKAQEVLLELDQMTHGDLVVTTDVGQHQMWAAQFMNFNQPNHWLSSGGAGTMGYGFPSAIGAQLAEPHKKVVAVVGDGGFQMTMAELATAVRLKLPLKILILDNKYLGMVRQWQGIFYENRLSASDLHDNPDFVRLAQSFGAKGFHLNSRTNIQQVLQAALDYNEGPCLIHAEVEKEEGVFPMVPSGQFADKMILEAPEENKMSTRKAPPVVIPVATPAGSSVKTLDLELKVIPEENLFLRIGFVLSKKMFSLLSYELVGDRLFLKVQGSEAEFGKLIKLLNKAIKVVEVRKKEFISESSTFRSAVI